MNQEKIGKFIAECRKEKNMTQEQLAEKLGITYKAVSKWETGKGMPDSSIMLDLCYELCISVNELLSGERLATENYQENAEKNLVELQAKKERAMRNYKKIEKILVVVTLLLIPVHFAINFYYPDNNGTGIGLLILFIQFIMYVFFFFTHYEIKIKLK